jgi:hypothetical protein
MYSKSSPVSDGEFKLATLGVKCLYLSKVISVGKQLGYNLGVLSGTTVIVYPAKKNFIRITVGDQY